jgi:hypothetical protein
VGQFVYVIRKRIKLSPEKAIFIFVKNVLPPTGVHVGELHEGKYGYESCTTARWQAKHSSP